MTAKEYGLWEPLALISREDIRHGYRSSRRRSPCPARTWQTPPQLRAQLCALACRRLCGLRGEPRAPGLARHPRRRAAHAPGRGRRSRGCLTAPGSRRKGPRCDFFRTSPVPQASHLGLEGLEARTEPWPPLEKSMAADMRACICARTCPHACAHERVRPSDSTGLCFVDMVIRT